MKASKLELYSDNENAEFMIYKRDRFRAYYTLIMTYGKQRELSIKYRKQNHANI